MNYDGFIHKENPLALLFYMKLAEEIKTELRVRFAKLETVEQLAELLQWIYQLKFPVRSEKTQVII